MAVCGPKLRINGPSVIYGGEGVRLGTNVSFNGIFISGAGGVTIGDNFHSARNVRIFSVNHDYDHGSALPYGPEVVSRPVVIENNVWLADGVIVCPGARVGEGVVAGAGAVLRGQIPAFAVVVGNPAQVVRYRDREHYEMLSNRDGLT